MRPNVSKYGKKEYECPSCGERTWASTATHCETCQRRLVNIGRERDL